MNEVKKTAWEAIDAAAARICAMSDGVWEAAETAFCEEKSAKLQCDLLEELGFRVEKGLGGIPTAFSGRWGSGRPVIGILGEFDALTGLSQKAGLARPEALVKGGNGHGCGHNLLGAGAVAAAYGVKEYLRRSGAEGTVVYLGCPGEEGGSGKAFMAREGVVDELDCALTWHPMDVTSVWDDSTLANFQMVYRFRGISAHAAAAPFVGRSALDAVELMNVGVQFLREHVPSDVRVHYAITKTGGTSPNVVQSDAEVLYLIRAHHLDDVQDTCRRVNDIARGAALMTETQVEIRFIKACSNILLNSTLGEVLQKNLDDVPYPEYTQEELDFAAAIGATLETKSDTMDQLLPRLDFETACSVREKMGGPYYNFVLPRVKGEGVRASSTDVGDVSWACPTGQVQVASWAAGTAAHTWQVVAQGKSTMAHKSVVYTGKVLAGAAIDLLNSPETVEKAKEELHRRRGGKPFVSPIPADADYKTVKALFEQQKKENG